MAREPHKVMCAYPWGTCQPAGGSDYSHVCDVWIYPGESHDHHCGVCGSN